MKKEDVMHWQDWLIEDAFVKESEQESRLGILSDKNKRLCGVLGLNKFDSADNYLLQPNIKVIKECNKSFIELMMNHSHKYSVRRIVPIQIIRSLIDVGCAMMAYLHTEDKKHFLEEYMTGKDFAKIDKKMSISKYVNLLNADYPFVEELYRECCNYVHSSYLPNKAQRVFDYLIKPGKIGFMGKYYKLKSEDFINDIRDGVIDVDNIPYDYEEEVDIIDSCIKVNDMLWELINKIKCT